ncbi:single-stranded DNA-binding protein [Actinocrispum sp. NPDC049592]|uniref:single-stranded DNA-binding protein n=1 Tax=Actinocrispum sp. NPDC049592 TaxID=3154835 RepID=UPI00341DA65A
MAWNETKLTVVGAVCNDIRTRTTNDGEPMLFFTIASHERKFNRDTETWENGNSVLVKVKAFRKLAEHAGASLVPGDRVVATGRVYTNKYEVDGQTRSDLEMEASCIGPDLTICPVTIERGGQLAAVAA